MQLTEYSSLRFGLYARKSSDGDERQVESIEDQNNVLKELARQHGLRIVKLYSEACSAKAPDIRHEFYVMLDDLKNGVIDAILCWHLDRLSRNPIDSALIGWPLQRGELKLIKTPYREYRPEDSVVVFAVETSGANQQIIDQSRNVKRGLSEKAGRGVWPLHPPAGYRSVEIMVGPRVRHSVAVDEKRFPLLRRAYDLMLTGSYTGVQVRLALNSWGYRSPKSRTGKTGGKPMSRANLYQFLKNPFYYGCFMYKGELLRGSHRPLVTKAEFDEVQRILGRENRIRPQKHEFPFTGLIRCGICRHFATAEQHVKHYRTTGNTRVYVYYHCGNHQNCRRSITQGQVEEQLERWLESMTIKPELAAYVEGVLKRDLEELPMIGTTILKQRHEALGAVERRLDTLFEMRQYGEISGSEFVERKSRCRTEITTIQVAIAEMQKVREQVLGSIQNGLDYLTTAYQRFTQGSDREKRQVATLLADEYALTLGKFEITPHPLLDLLRSIEPPSEDLLQVQRPASRSRSLAMSAVTDHILTLVTEEGKVFPKLDVTGQNSDLSPRRSSKGQSSWRWSR